MRMVVGVAIVFALTRKSNFLIRQNTLKIGGGGGGGGDKNLI